MILFFVFLFCYTATTHCFVHYDEYGQVQAPIFHKDFIVPQVLEVSVRQKLSAQTQELAQQIETLKEVIKKEDEHCKNIENFFRNMSVSELEQESKRSYLPCILKIEILKIQLKKLCTDYNEIIKQLR